MPPIYGLYAGLVPLLVYPLFGSSRQLAVGPVAMVSLLVAAAVAVAAAVVLFYGVYGYFVPANVRIGLSVPQVLAVLFAMVAVTGIDIFLFRNARKRGEIEWGSIKPRAQYALFFIAITFAWTMGLMGYVRAGMRQHWHVYGVVEDTSQTAFTPTLGFASNVISVTVLLFFILIAIIFWLTGLSGKEAWKMRSDSSTAEGTGA